MRIVLFISALLTGCTVYDTQINKAIKLCEPHGGIYSLDTVFTANDPAIIKCNDGTKITAPLEADNDV